MKFRYQKLPVRGQDPTKPLVPRPYLPVYLLGKEKGTPCPYYALLDSGADGVLFPSELAMLVGIDDMRNGRGPFYTVGIANQRAEIFYHTLDIQVQGDERKLQTDVGFSDVIFIPILGRSFFQHFKDVVFHEAKEQVELK